MVGVEASVAVVLTGEHFVLSSGKRRAVVVRIRQNRHYLPRGLSALMSDLRRSLAYNTHLRTPPDKLVVGAEPHGNSI